jgi:hypothetical protein
VLVHRAGNGTTHPASPLLTLTVLATLVVEVLLAVNVTTVSLAPAATPAAFVHVIVPAPTTLGGIPGVHTQPAPAAAAVIVTPAGTLSVITVFTLLPTGPVLLTLTVYVNTPPCASVATLAVLFTTRFGWLESVTVTVPPQRPAPGHPGSPLVALAVLVTLPVPVLLTVSVTTLALTAPAATPVALTQLT